MEFAGKGNRRPLLDVNISLIQLDNKNPRLTPYLDKSENHSQEQLIDTLFRHFDSEIVGLSLVQNGYFDEEPIIVIPQNLPANFNYDDYNNVKELTEVYEELIKNENLEFIVVEGNRRVSAIKLITNEDIRKRLGVNEIFPKSDNADILADISNIPAIIYPTREDVFTYLGIRHIAGNLKWEAFAQASYTSEMIEYQINLGKDVDEAIKEVQKIIAHRSDKLVKQYVTFQLYKQAKVDLDFDVKPIVNKFSLLTVAYNSGAIRDYIGVPKYSQVDFSRDIVPEGKLEEFKNVLTWIYGDIKQNKKPIVGDSRNITSKLSHIVRKAEAIDYLIKFEDIDEAYDRTNGEEEYLVSQVQKAIRTIQSSLQYAYKYKNNVLLKGNVEELKEIVAVLENNLK